ncbi:hypothetical protein [Pseudomonas farsensis]|uniref:Uncharacterized protein n=1 Tax=Pseudomonas farsensis TaxID=2745492 RepID=A0ABU8QN66_9PSED
MDITSIPATVFVALGVVTAALLTGMFSIMNMVSSKENKVSEFRLAWIDGLREEIAGYASAAQELSRALNAGEFIPSPNSSAEEAQKLEIDLYKETREAYARAVENLTKIQLRLNPESLVEGSKSPEAKLMAAVERAREISNDDPDETLNACNEIRSAAAPILKSTWNSVKSGEPAYRRLRVFSILSVGSGLIIVVLVITYIGYSTYKTHQLEERNTLINHFIEAEKKLERLRTHEGNSQ